MRVNDWLVPAGEARELTRAEIEAGLYADPEVTLISDYLSKTLDDAQARDVERRLRDDEGFRTKVGPIVAAWNAWPTVDDIEIADDRMEASWKRLMQRVERQGDGDEDRAERRHASADAAGDRRFIRQLRRWQLAAGIACVVGLPAALWLGGTYVRRSAPPQVHMVDVPARESQVARVSDDSWAVVSAGSRLTWRDAATEGGVRELVLDGEARFSMTKVQAGHYVVVTPAARVIVTGTEFTVDATDPVSTKVRVTEGRVVLASRGADAAEPVALGVGERGVATWGQPARRAR
ncbi:MAG: FecR domain-containing protein [Gemmatimonadetes bacterium]|nr:FecR domain-containing protein [Gemmatimonadota bacterium]